MPGYELIGKEEKKAVNDIFDNGSVLFAHGFEKKRKNYHVREFEKKINKYFNCKYSLAVSSGTAAIKIALKSLGVKKGDEVITQAFNFIATIEAIIDVGAKPVLVNVDHTLNMDPNLLVKKITKKTKVVLPVHMLGYPCNMDKIKKICKEKKIKIVEDNCESLGGKYKNKFLGNLGDVGILSFDFGKTITTGEGGMILTNNKKIYDYCREYHDHGHKNIAGLSRGKDKVKIPGFNYRMTELQGAIGKVQLKKLKTILSNNKIKYDILKKNILSFRKRDLPIYGKSNFDCFIFFVSKNSKKKIIEILNNFNIGTKNLPDAIKWHCAYYWKHIFTKKECLEVKFTYNLLKSTIAIPILFTKKKLIYKKIASKINNINV